jgi:hypothetical protein
MNARKKPSPEVTTLPPSPFHSDLAKIRAAEACLKNEEAALQKLQGPVDEQRKLVDTAKKVLVLCHEEALAYRTTRLIALCKADPEVVDILAPEHNHKQVDETQDETCPRCFLLTAVRNLPWAPMETPWAFVLNPES